MPKCNLGRLPLRLGLAAYIHCQNIKKCSVVLPKNLGLPSDSGATIPGKRAGAAEGLKRPICQAVAVRSQHLWQESRSGSSLVLQCLCPKRQAALLVAPLPQGDAKSSNLGKQDASRLSFERQISFQLHLKLPHTPNMFANRIRLRGSSGRVRQRQRMIFTNPSRYTRRPTSSAEYLTRRKVTAKMSSTASLCSVTATVQQSASHSGAPRINWRPRHARYHSSSKCH